MMRAFVLLAGILILGGCATTTEKSVFQFTHNPTTDRRGLIWPPEQSGEIPRYIFLGELTGEDNFVKPKSSGDSTKSLIARFFDIVIGEAPPVVLDRPQTGVVDESGRILVTDIGRSVVFVFDEKEGKLSVWEKASGLVEFITPVGIAVGPAGEVFVADSELALIARLDRDGNTGKPIGKGQLKRPTGLAYENRTKRLYVTDTQDHQIKIFDLEGNLLDSYGEHGEGPGQFNYPTHIAVAHEKLYVSDSMNARIQVLSTATGRYLGSIGKRGLFLGNLVRPKGVAADSEHNVYVIESYHDYMLIYNRRGEFLMPIGSVGFGAGNFHLPAGVWVDARNRVFVADTLNSRVAVFQYLGGDEGDGN
jgi:DNA-binding beta-propeller fold protein YncE